MNADNSGELTSLSLIERVQANEPTAWTKLQELYAPLIVQWCRWARVPEQEIADIAQDVFVAVTRNIQKFSKAKAGQSFRGWLRSITQSKIIDAYRAKAHSPPADGGTDALRRLSEQPELLSSDESTVQAKEEVVILYRRAMEIVVREFPEWYGKAVWSLVVDDRTAQDVAAQHQVEPHAVYNAKSRVLARLRQEFRELID